MFFYLAIYFRISYTKMFESFSKTIFIQFLTVRLMKNLSIGPNIFWKGGEFFKKLVRGIYPNVCRDGI
jgi:hypothetical protein